MARVAETLIDRCTTRPALMDLCAVQETNTIFQGRTLSVNSGRVQLCSLDENVGLECFTKMVPQLFESFLDLAKHLTHTRTVHSKKKLYIFLPPRRSFAVVRCNLL